MESPAKDNREESKETWPPAPRILVDAYDQPPMFAVLACFEVAFNDGALTIGFNMVPEC
jgi:hypothetical protein